MAGGRLLPRTSSAGPRTPSYPDLGSLINRVLAMRPTVGDGESPQDIRRTLILTAKTLALVDPECARQMLLSITSNDPSADTARAVMDNRDLLVAWALADLPYATELVETWMAAPGDGNVWCESLIRLCDALTTPPDRRARVIDRFQGTYWFPGEDL